MFQTKVVRDKIKTRAFCSITFFFENRAIYEITWKNIVTVGQATDASMAHGYCMIDTQGYKHTLRVCNDYCFCTATMATRKHLNVTLHYIACLVYL
jgi:hypothetical protein